MPKKLLIKKPCSKQNDPGITDAARLQFKKMMGSFAPFFAEYGELGIAVLKHFNHSGEDAIKEARVLLENNYYGAFKNKIDFVQAEHARIKIAAPKERAACQNIADHWFTYTYFYLRVGDAFHVFDRPRMTH